MDRIRVRLLLPCQRRELTSWLSNQYAFMMFGVGGLFDCVGDVLEERTLLRVSDRNMGVREG